MTTLIGRMAVSAAQRPDLKVGVEGDTVPLAEALGRAATVARGIASSGIAPGQRVAMIDASSTGYIVSWLACLLSGNPVALINPTYPDELLDQMLAIFEPALVWRSGDIAANRQVTASAIEGLPGLAGGALDVISYMHTSGTTGVPKFCAQTNDYFIHLARDMGAALELTPADRVLAPLPLFHINPMGYGLVTGVLAGCDVMSLEKFSASGFWRTVKNGAITVLVLHAPPVEILKRATTLVDAAGHSVRTMFYANREFMDTFEVPAAVSGYGSTEAGGISHIKQWETSTGMPDNASRHGGPARPGIEWRLDEAGGIFVREREPGTLFAGYARAEGLDPARDADGWFDTGDLGARDDAGDLVFLERGAESIRVKGEFVPIPFLEERIATLPELRDFAVWKRKGELVDDDVVLYVVADAVPAAQIMSALADAPPFMHPVAVARIAAIPRDAAAGKVQRRLLTDQEVIEWVSL